MDFILDEYEIKEIYRERHVAHDEHMRYLLQILNNRSIPEKYKIDVRKQFDEFLRIMYMPSEPPKMVIEHK